MNRAWHGTLGQAVIYATNGELLPRVGEGFHQSYGRSPSPQEEQAWAGSLPTTIQMLSQGLDPGVHVVVEYQLPFNDQRADLVLLGRRGGQSTAHVIELKYWQASEIHPHLDNFVLAAGRPASHPSYQAANYAGKLRYFHSEAQHWHVEASAFVSDTSRESHSGLLDAKYRELVKSVPLFLPGEGNQLARHVEREVGSKPETIQVSDFMNGRYSQSLRLLEALGVHQAQISKGAIAAVARSGWGLSEEQLLLLDSVVAAAREGRPGTFLVSGGPGCGKTLLALHLLLALAGSGKTTVLAVRNNRLNASLKKIIDFQPFGARGIIKYFSTQGRAGVEDGTQTISDVLICDEGQRLSMRTSNVFRRAPITVVFYDEKQMLNMEEGGTREALMHRTDETGSPKTEFSLATLHRCRGGKAYMAWVDKLLASPENIGGAPKVWSNSYTFEVEASPESLIGNLATKGQNGIRVALLASFTRSSGRDGQVNREGLGKVRIPETSPKITWLMDAEKDYVPFWVEGRSNDLLQCSSIYGCQGFETDHAGLFWGDDLVIRNGRWELGNPDNVYDTAPGATRLANVMRQNRTAALRLLSNRYRILLTRGIFSTAIYCEDRETGEFLKGCLQEN